MLIKKSSFIESDNATNESFFGSKVITSEHKKKNTMTKIMHNT